MPDIDDFFTEGALPDGPPRDRYGRPMLVVKPHTTGLCSLCADKGDDKGHRKPYTRASSLSDYLADFAHIWKWKFRYLTRAMGQNSDLAMLAGAECYTTGFDQGELKENRASGRRLDDIAERALERGKISERADYGTAWHALTEPGNDGYVSNSFMVKDVRSYVDLVAKLNAVILGTELFCANDELMTAGTFDNLMFVPGYGIVITDKKSAREVHGEDFRIQLSSYANSELYDWENDTRQSLEDYVASKGWDPALINRDKGLIFWTASHTGVAEAVELDLVKGYEAAHHAVWVRDNHRKGKHKWPAKKKIIEARESLEGSLLRWIETAPDAATLGSLWNRWGKTIWNDKHTAAAVARKGAL